MRIGYACINLHLAAEKVKVNRSLIKRIFVEKGIAHASSIVLANFIDLEKVIDWNIANRLLLYRMSSDMIPWMSEYEITDLPDYEKIKDICTRCAQKIMGSGLRLTYHPGPFNVLATNSSIVLSNTIKELRQHAEIMDLLQLPATTFSKINIHVGGAYGDKIAALARFAETICACRIIQGTGCQWKMMTKPICLACRIYNGCMNKLIFLLCLIISIINSAVVD